MDFMASGQVLDQIETPYGGALMGRIGEVGRQEEYLGTHICKRSYSRRNSPAAFSQEKS